MIITVNGEKQTLAQTELTVADLLVTNNVSRPEMVSVQVNGQFVDKVDYATKKVAENDEVDFLYFMGGGKVS